MLNKVTWQGLPQPISGYAGDRCRHTQAFTWDWYTSLVNNFLRSSWDQHMFVASLTFTWLRWREELWLTICDFFFQKASGYKDFCWYLWNLPQGYLEFIKNGSWYYYCRSQIYCLWFIISPLCKLFILPENYVGKTKGETHQALFSSAFPLPKTILQI